MPAALALNILKWHTIHNDTHSLAYALTRSHTNYSYDMTHSFRPGLGAHVCFSYVVMVLYFLIVFYMP